MTTDTATAMSALDAATKKFVDHAGAGAAQVTQPWSQELATTLLWRTNAPAQQVLRVFGVISIIGFSSLLLVVGYNNEQLTPIVGLFGAIAGYLLGKDTRSGKDD